MSETLSAHSPASGIGVAVQEVGRGALVAPEPQFKADTDSEVISAFLCSDERGTAGRQSEQTSDERACSDSCQPGQQAPHPRSVQLGSADALDERSQELSEDASAPPMGAPSEDVPTRVASSEAGPVPCGAAASPPARSTTQIVEQPDDPGCLRFQSSTKPESPKLSRVPDVGPVPCDAAVSPPARPTTQIVEQPDAPGCVRFQSSKKPESPKLSKVVSAVRARCSDASGRLQFEFESSPTSTYSELGREVVAPVRAHFSDVNCGLQFGLELSPAMTYGELCSKVLEWYRSHFGDVFEDFEGTSFRFLHEEARLNVDVNGPVESSGPPGKILLSVEEPRLAVSYDPALLRGGPQALMEAAGRLRNQATGGADDGSILSAAEARPPDDTSCVSSPSWRHSRSQRSDGGHAALQAQADHGGYPVSPLQGRPSGSATSPSQIYQGGHAERALRSQQGSEAELPSQSPQARWSSGGSASLQDALALQGGVGASDPKPRSGLASHMLSVDSRRPSDTFSKEEAATSRKSEASGRTSACPSDASGLSPLGIARGSAKVAPSHHAAVSARMPLTTDAPMHVQGGSASIASVPFRRTAPAGQGYNDDSENTEFISHSTALGIGSKRGRGGGGGDGPKDSENTEIINPEPARRSVVVADTENTEVVNPNGSTNGPGDLSKGRRRTDKSTGGNCDATSMSTEVLRLELSPGRLAPGSASSPWQSQGAFDERSFEGAQATFLSAVSLDAIASCSSGGGVEQDPEEELSGNDGVRSPSCGARRRA